MKRLGNPAYRRLGIQGLPYGFGSPSSKSYLRRILTPNPGVGYDPSSLILYHPMNESAGGVAIDHSPEGNDGAYTGVTLGAPGIGDGLVCPFFDGTGDRNNIYSVPFRNDFDGDNGSLLIWMRAFNVGVWTDGQTRLLAILNTGAGVYIYIRKHNTNNNLQWRRLSGAGPIVTRGGMVTTDWFCAGITWTGGATFQPYFNGVPEGAPQATGAWVGVLGAGTTLIGASTIAGAEPMHGWEAHGAVYNAPLPATAMAYLGQL